MVNESPIIIESKTARYLKFLTWKLLRVIERRISLYKSASSADLEHLTKTHQLFFGSKVSLVDALVKTVDLMLRLHQLFPSAGTRMYEKEEAHPFSSTDIALIENFIARKKAQSDLIK